MTMTELKPNIDSIYPKEDFPKVWWFRSRLVGMNRGPAFVIMAKTSFQSTKAIKELSTLQVVTADERVLLPEGCDKIWNRSIANSNISAMFEDWHVTKDGRSSNVDATVNVTWDNSEEEGRAELQFMRKVKSVGCIENNNSETQKGSKCENGQDAVLLVKNMVCAAVGENEGCCVQKLLLPDTLDEAESDKFREDVKAW